jgi:transcriptional regulator with XRE-family HTH domain
MVDFDHTWGMEPSEATRNHPFYKLRTARGLSTRQLAELAGVSESAIKYIEEGRTRRPHRRTVRDLAEALGMHPEDLQERLEAA